MYPLTTLGIIKFSASEELLLFEQLDHLSRISSATEVPKTLRDATKLLYDRIHSRDPTWYSPNPPMYDYCTGEASSPTCSVNPRTKNEFLMIEAMKELNDPLIAVRAHGLLKLRELILSKDQHVMDNMQQLIDLIKTSLQEEDEYVV